MKWFIRLSLAGGFIALIAGAIAAYSFSINRIPKLYLTSPAAWLDAYRIERLKQQLDLDDPDNYYSTLFAEPAYDRAHARWQIHYQHAVRQLGYYNGGWMDFGTERGVPIYSFLPSYILEDAEPEPPANSAAILRSLEDCQVVDHWISPLTQYGRDWNLNGSPPVELVGQAESGNLDAQHDLGVGAYFVEDEQIAESYRDWLRLSAEAGHPRSMAIYGAMLVTDLERPLEQRGIGAEMVRRASEAGDFLGKKFDARSPARPGELPYEHAERVLNLEIELAQACDLAGFRALAWRRQVGRGFERDPDHALDLMLMALNAETSEWATETPAAAD